MTSLENKNHKSYLSNALLRKLHKTSQTIDVKSSFRAKLAKSSHHFPELEIFKIQCEKEKQPSYAPFYCEVERRLFKYRLVFFGFGCLFLMLSLAVHFLSLHHYSIFFDTTFKVQWILSAATSLLSLLAFFCAFIPCTFHEATLQVVKQGEKALRLSYKKKRIQHGLDSIFLWGDRSRKSDLLRQRYLEVVEALHEEGKETYRLLQKISTLPSIKNRGLLYNQALAELHDKLSLGVHKFSCLEFDSAARLQTA